MSGLDRGHETEPVPKATGEPTGPLDNVPQAVIDVLGEEACRQISLHLDNIQQLDALSHARDPFKRDRNDRSGDQSDIDLSSFDPEIIKYITEHKIDRQASEYRLFSEYSLGTLHPKTLISLGHKLITKGMDSLAELVKKTELAEGDFAVIETGINEVAEEDEEGSGSAPDLSIEELRAWISGLEDTAGKLPSSADLLMVEKLLVGSDDCAHKQKGSIRSLGSIRARLAIFASPLSDKILKGELKTFGELRGSVNSIRERGRSVHGLIKKLTIRKLMSESSQLLEEISTANSNMLEQIGSDAENAEKYKETEDYLQEHARLGREILKNAPGSAEKARLRAGFRGVLRPAVESALSDSDAPAPEELAPFKITDEFLKNLGEAKDILRSARRLEPGQGQTKEEIEAKADKLHALKNEAKGTGKLLLPEENGVIMAIVTGRFETFRKTTEQARILVDEGSLSALPEHRADVAGQLTRFDLIPALEKLRDVMFNAATYEQMEEILGPQDLKKVEATVNQVLAEEDEQRNQAA